MPATLADIQAKYGDSVYPLYKEQMHEPYMENNTGNGYQGVVLHNEIEDKVKCFYCDEWFVNMGSHLRKHKVTADDAKREFGVPLKIQLCANYYSSLLRKMAENNKNAKKTRFTTKQAKSFTHKRVGGVGQHTTAFAKNQKGLCDAQIVARLEILRHYDKNAKITTSNLYKYDIALYKVLASRYKTIEKAGEAWHFNVDRKGKYQDAEIISKLRKWTLENKRLPNAKDFRSNIAPCYRIFGSWRRAKMMAGLDQLLAETKTPPRNDLSG